LKADKDSIIAIMDKNNYITECCRQLGNDNNC
jgi:hypothetical protein